MLEASWPYWPLESLELLEIVPGEAGWVGRAAVEVSRLLCIEGPPLLLMQVVPVAQLADGAPATDWVVDDVSDALRMPIVTRLNPAAFVSAAVPLPELSPIDCEAVPLG